MMTSTSFPMILFDIVESQMYPDAIGWGENGRLWIDPVLFQKDALKVHFRGVTKFTSFTRKLNRYGFKRIMEKDGHVDRIFVYHHDTFRQGVIADDVKVIRIKKKPASDKSKQFEPPPEHGHMSAVTQLPIEPSSNTTALSRQQSSTTVHTDDTILQRLILRHYLARPTEHLVPFTLMSENHLQQGQLFLNQALFPAVKRVVNELPICLDGSVSRGEGTVRTSGIVNRGIPMIPGQQEPITSRLFLQQRLSSGNGLDTASGSMSPSGASDLFRLGIQEQLPPGIDIVTILSQMGLFGFK